MVVARASYLREYWCRLAARRRGVSAQRDADRDVGHEFIAASDESERGSDMESEDECEGSNDVYYRRGGVSNTRGGRPRQRDS